jgi:hypothetical protein
VEPVVFATWALVAATVVLAIVAGLQVRQMRSAASEATRQTETFTRQAELLEEGLSVNREMLAQARADREDAAPFSIAAALHRDSVAGQATFEFRNPGARGSHPSVAPRRDCRDARCGDAV